MWGSRAALVPAALLMLLAALLLILLLLPVAYRDVGEEEYRYMLFKANRRFVVNLNAAAPGKTAYGLNQFGDLTNEEVRDWKRSRGLVLLGIIDQDTGFNVEKLLK
uniref:Cathepsin propeptide inhibitor domain-containing protein n=1 Tax=Oryza brachyantha TaxID=4533 RepID=J3MRC7_ORYBR